MRSHHGTPHPYAHRVKFHEARYHFNKGGRILVSEQTRSAREVRRIYSDGCWSVTFAVSRLSDH